MWICAATQSGLASYYHTQGRNYSRPILEFGEVPHFMVQDPMLLHKLQPRWYDAIWVGKARGSDAVSYTHLRAHETSAHL
eukprot:3192892-Alexandrium_andersonii.AAC.1